MESGGMRVQGLLEHKTAVDVPASLACDCADRGVLSARCTFTEGVQNFV